MKKRISTTDNTLFKRYSYINWNTIVLFNKYNFRESVYSVYLSARILKRNIDVKSVQKVLLNIDKNIISSFKINSALKKLYKYGFLYRNKYNNFSVINQANIGINNQKHLKDNFYNTRFVLDKYLIEYYKKESSEDSWCNFINSYMISDIWYNINVTRDEIEQTIGLSPKRTRKLKVFKTQTYYTFVSKKLSAFDECATNTITLGNTYSHKYNPFVVIKSNYIYNKYFSDINNNYVTNQSIRNDIRKTNKGIARVEVLHKLKSHNIINENKSKEIPAKKEFKLEFPKLTLKPFTIKDHLESIERRKRKESLNQENVDNNTLATKSEIDNFLGGYSLEEINEYNKKREESENDDFIVEEKKDVDEIDMVGIHYCDANWVKEQKDICFGIKKKNDNDVKFVKPKSDTSFINLDKIIKERDEHEKKIIDRYNAKKDEKCKKGKNIDIIDTHKITKSNVPNSYKMRKLTHSEIPYMSENKQQFISKLSEKYLMSNIKNKKFKNFKINSI